MLSEVLPTIVLRQQAVMGEALPGPWAVPMPDRKTTKHSSLLQADKGTVLTSTRMPFHYVARAEQQAAQDVVETVTSSRPRAPQTPSKLPNVQVGPPAK